MRGVRKLACISIGYSLAVIASAYLIPCRGRLLSALTAAFLSLAGLLLKDRKRLTVLLLGLSFALGCVLFGLHEERTVNACNELNGKTESLCMTVLEYPEMHEDYNSVTVKLNTDSLPRVRMKLYDYSDALKAARPGDAVIAETKLKSSAIRYGEENDSYIADGVYLLGNISGECEIYSAEKMPVRFLPQRLAGLIKSGIKDSFPDDTSGFMLALLLGDKSEYYENDSMYTSMSIAGLSHVVAVSGMHVTFVLALFQLVFGKSKRVSAISLIFVWLYVLMSGASPSALRAGIMLTVFLLAPVFGRENDRLTTLSLALMIILLVNPFAVMSLSLQLSFAAMAGIFCFTQRIFNFVDRHIPEAGRSRRIKLYVNGAFSNSIAATVFTLPIIAFRFGSIAILAPIANILCLWAVSILFVGGYLVCLIKLISGILGTAVAMLLSYLVRYIELVSGYIARLPFAQIYTGNLYAVLWIVLCYALFLGFMLERKKGVKVRLALPVILSAVSLASVLFWTDLAMKHSGGAINVLDVGNGQCIALTCGKETSVIDCGAAGKSINAGTELANMLHAEGRRKIDCLVLTHIHSDHANGAARLMGLMDVDTLVIPENAAENADDGLLESILSAADKNGVRVVEISKDTEINTGTVKLGLIAPYPEGDKNERGLMLKAKVNDITLLITGDVSQSTERKLVRDRELSDTDILIVGHHGSKYSTSQELLIEASPDTAIISVGFNNYGHPSDAVLYKLNYYGADVYRTDTSGKIRIICGD